MIQMNNSPTNKTKVSHDTNNLANHGSSTHSRVLRHKITIFSQWSLVWFEQSNVLVVSVGSFPSFCQTHNNKLSMPVAKWALLVDAHQGCTFAPQDLHIAAHFAATACSRILVQFQKLLSPISHFNTKTWGNKVQVEIPFFPLKRKLENRLKGKGFQRFWQKRQRFDLFLSQKGFQAKWTESKKKEKKPFSFLDVIFWMKAGWWL